MGGDKGEGSIQNVENYGIINKYEVLIAGAQIHIIWVFAFLNFWWFCSFQTPLTLHSKGHLYISRCLSVCLLQNRKRKADSA